MKPFRIGLECHYGPMWMDEYILADSEEDALEKYQKLKPHSRPDEAVSLPEWFPWLNDFENIKHLIDNIDGVFSWPKENLDLY